MIYQFDEALAAETRIVSSVDDVDRQAAQALHRLNVSGGIGPGDSIKQGTVVDGVPREQRAGSRLPESDTARRMPWYMNHFEGGVTEIQLIAFVDEGSASGYYYPATQLQEVGLGPFNLSGAFFCARAVSKPMSERGKAAR